MHSTAQSFACGPTRFQLSGTGRRAVPFQRIGMSWKDAKYAYAHRPSIPRSLSNASAGCRPSKSASLRSCTSARSRSAPGAPHASRAAAHPSSFSRMIQEASSRRLAWGAINCARTSAGSAPPRPPPVNAIARPRQSIWTSAISCSASQASTSNVVDPSTSTSTMREGRSASSRKKRHSWRSSSPPACASCSIRSWR